MTTALSQIAVGSPPKLAGATLLQIDLANTPGVLLHDLGSALSVLHCRLMIGTNQASGGQCAVMGGIDDSGRWSWQLTLDADSQSLRLDAGTGQCTANLSTAFDWHCVEVGLNASTDSVTLRVNGVERDAASATLSPTQHVWVGGALFTDGLVGTLQIDQWTLATTPIGIPLATPQYDHAGEPRRWLVVYNRSDNDSAAWADLYRDRRGVPYANLCGLDLPSSETITAGQYEMLRQQINDYLDDNSLRDQIVGVLLGFGVPGYADVSGIGALTSIASYLHTDDTHGQTVVNPLYQNPITQRPTSADYASARLTGRIDAASLADAIELLDRADAVIAQPLAHDQPADIVIDINPDNINVGPVYTQPVADWAAGDGLASLRLPATVFDEAAPVSVSGEAVLWGWRDAAPPPGFIASPAGRRALCLQYHPDPQAAVSARTPAATDWLTAALQAGYAAAASPSRAFSMSSLQLPELLFEPLRLGWTLAEAWVVGRPFLRDGLQIIGDPLMTITMPKAGYDVFGPVQRLDQVDLDQPIAKLHAGQRTFELDPDDVPGSGSAARYLVRRLDDQGRSDLASAAAFVAIEQGQVIRPSFPAWPSAEGWRVTQRDGRARLTAIWPASLQALGVDRVQLQSQVGSDAPVLVDEKVAANGQHRLTFAADLPPQPTRYRFRIVQGPLDYDTPWSQWVLPASVVNETLTLLETQS